MIRYYDAELLAVGFKKLGTRFYSWNVVETIHCGTAVYSNDRYCYLSSRYHYS